MNIENTKFLRDERFPSRMPVFNNNAPSFTDSRQNIVLGDVLDVMSRMKTGSIDVVVTSPPYNIGMRYRSYDDRRPRHEYLAWMNEIAEQIARVLKDDGAAWLCCAKGALGIVPLSLDRLILRPLSWACREPCNGS